MSQSEARKGSSERQFNLWWALAISVLLHVVLALVSGWIPMISSTPIAEPPEDSVLQFTFNQPTEELVEQDSPPRGDVPFETPQPQPQPSIEPTPPPVDPGFEVQPPMPEPAEPREAVEPATENPVENDQTELTKTVDPESAEFPEQLEGPVVNDPGEESATRPDRQPDLDRMMQDFGRQLDHARAAEPPRPAGDGPPRNVFVPDPSEFATTGYGLGNLTFETADFDWSDYARSIYIEIWRAWHNRLLRLVNEFEKWSYQNREPILQHWNQILFVIERSGEVSQILIETPSGCVPLDSSATQALEEVILPPLPAAFPKEREIVHARFIASGEIRFMRPGLTRMKALNYF